MIKIKLIIKISFLISIFLTFMFGLIGNLIQGYSKSKIAEYPHLTEKYFKLKRVGVIMSENIFNILLIITLILFILLLFFILNMKKYKL